MDNGDKIVLAKIGERVEMMAEETLPEIKESIKDIRRSIKEDVVSKSECAMVSSRYSQLATEFGWIKKGVIVAIISAVATIIIAHV